MKSRDNVIKRKSFLFAVRIINLYKLLQTERKEYIMSKQMLRSGTSIGANIREAINAQSKVDFIHKLSISQKECDEILYWLELLKETNYIHAPEFQSISTDHIELLKMIRSIIMTSKNIIHNS